LVLKNKLIEFAKVEIILIQNKSVFAKKV